VGQPTFFASSPPVLRTFCGACGTGLTYTNTDRPGDVDIATAALDHPDSFPPQGIVFPSNRISWDSCLDKPVAHDEV
jgi:hypothetical protein